MSLQRIYAIFIRHYLQVSRDMTRYLDTFYWPFLDITTFGFLGMWAQGENNSAPVGMMILAALMFWQMVSYTQRDVCIGLIEELWGNNLINTFATPLSLFEWVFALMGLSVVRTLITTVFSIFLVRLFYGINLLSIGFVMLPLGLLLLVCGWILSFFTLGLIIRLGQRVQALTWMVGWLFVPVSGVFYPVSMLPAWLQACAQWLPMPYLFEGLRLFIMTGQIPLETWYMSILLCALYGTISLLFLRYMFNQSKILGLARLHND